jgi:uncharacterized repeat protein (TIGR01451 family)
MNNKTFRTGRLTAARLAASAFLALTAFNAQAQQAPLEFSKDFSPSTIGPGSISTLTFTIDSFSPTPVTGLAFTDNLPAGVTIAEPAGATTTCGIGAQVTAPVGGSTIGFSGGSLPAAVEVASCQVSVNVTASTPGLYNNVSSPLTSDAGSAPAATADLEVLSNRPGFSKSFSPDSIVIGKRSTLTFTIDASQVGTDTFNVGFTDNLPGGLQVASPTNASIDCPGAFGPTAGATSVSLFSGFVTAGSTCTLSVDVVADDSAGSRANLTSDLTSTAGSSGKAGDVLDVRVEPLIKRFTDDPVPPGGTATLEFSIRNLDRSFTLTDIGFTDDLDATLTGLVALPPLPTDPCGAGSTLSGSSLLTLAGGSLAPGAVCTFQVTVDVPAGAAPGDYPNTTSSMSGQLGGEPVLFDPASDDLSVDVVPLLDKVFLDDPAGAGQTVDVEFTITNSSDTQAASDIAFSDSLSSFLGGTVAATPLPTVPCNGTGTLSQSTISGETSLLFSGGSLAAGASCTFVVPLEIPAGAPYGNYENVTSDITAVIDGVTRTGPPARDTLEVLSAPAPTKAFIDDPADPGGTVTLEFTLTHDEFAPADATGIAFSDDLDATLTGLAALGLPQNDVCGTGSTLSGTSVLSLAGGTLAPGETCTFSVTLQVPAGATPGFYPNTTSPVSATVSATTATGRTASDDLLISGLEASKSFIDSPVLPGQTTTLRFTLVNDNPSLDATGIAFTDNLSNTLAGLQATGLPANDICGAGSSISGTTNLVFTGGSVPAGGSCTFDVTLQVPPGAASGDYSNFTSAVSATYDGNSASFPPAADVLEVDDNIITLAKSFTDDPVAPGDNVTLEFTVGNISADDAITGITFTDDLDAALSGLVSTSGTLNDVCGTGSQITGTSLLTLSGGSLPAGGSCTFSVTLSVPAAVPGGAPIVNQTSTTSGSVGGIPVTGPAAADQLRVNQVLFSKAFAGPTGASGTVGLSFTLQNQGSDPVNGLAFTDDLDAVLTGLVASNLPLSDVCGPGSQVSGLSVLAFSGGALDPGESCSFQVLLSVPNAAAPGVYPNTTSDLTSGGLPIAAPATDDLSIEPPPAFSKAFSPATIGAGEVSTLTFTIDNSASAIAATDLAFSDALPAGTSIAAAPNAGTTCGGTLTASAGSGTISLSGGSVGAGASCTVSVDVTAAAEGSYDNVSSELSSSSGTSGPASATLQVVGTEFSIAKAFLSQPVIPGGLVDLEFSIDNPSQDALDDISFSDDLAAALSGLAAEGLPLADVCGTGSQLTGTSTIQLSGGSLAAGGNCSFVVSVRVPGDAAQGSFINTTSTATGIRQGVPAEAPAASADLVVEPLGFEKNITPQNVAPGGTVDISFVITNPDPVNAAQSLSFSDDLDAFVPGMTTGDTPLSDICGTGSTLNGASVLQLTGGVVPASGSCTITVSATVPADTASGDYSNVTSDLSGQVGSAPFAAGNAVSPMGVEGAPGFTKVFTPDQVGPGQVTTLVFTIDNSAGNLPADALAFVDPLPSGMQVASAPNVSNGCGGTLSAPAGSATISLSNGSVAAGAQCQISVDVISTVAGTRTNVTGDLTSTLGNSGAATASMTQFVMVPVTDRYWVLLMAMLLALIAWPQLRKH